MYSNKLILVALAATVTVSESACTNDKKWMINNKRSKNCDWVAKKPSSRCQKKGKNGKGNKVEANVACQESTARGDDETETSAEIVDVHVKACVASCPTPSRGACAFAGDTAYIAVAIENERDEDLGDGNPPQFPAGHVEIFTAKTANSELGVRLCDAAMTGLAGCDFPEDPEPEFVSVSPGNKAVVTMQENNCVAVVDLPTGAVDFSTASLAAVTAEPDGVVWIKGGAYFATANEGDMNGGSRSWSVFDGATGALVYDSGNFLEHLAASLGHDPEHRSENKGVEPENIAYGEFPDGAGGTRDFVFVNLERSSLVVVYDVTAFPTITYVQTLPAAMGPEGTVAVPAAGIVVTASEEEARDDKFRGALNVYELGTGGAPSFPTLVSQLPADGSAPIPFAALSSLTAEAGDLVLAVEDSAYGKSRVFEIDVGVAPAVVVGVRRGPRGYGTVGDAGRPVRSLNFLFVLGLSGPDYVIDKVIALPDAQNARQLRFGFEGVAVLDNKIVVAFQRAWGADEFPQMGVYDYAVGGDAGWSFVFYPVDEPSSQYGGWVGVGDIEAARSRLAAPSATSRPDRDNQGGMDAAVKRVYKANVFHYDADRVLYKHLVSSDMAKQGCWERHIVTRIVSYLNTRDRGLFLDVGANVGAFTATVAANDNDVIAVEPFMLNVRPRVPLIRRTMCGPERLDDRVSLYKMGLADSFPGPKMCIWSTNDEINRGNARMTPYFEGRRDFGQDKQKACMEVVYTDTLDHLLFDTHGLARRVDIYFEYQHDATVESGVDRHELFERLTRAGYKLNDFMKNEEVGSFTPEQWDGMRGGDLRAVLDDASCGWSSRGPPPPPPPPRVVGREPPPGCGPEAAADDDAPVACGCGLDGDWPEAPSKAPPDWLRVPRQSSAWAVTMVLALPACRGAPARSLREASACGPRDACVFDALKRSGDRAARDPAAGRYAAADGPTGITLRNYGFADHGDVCAKEAFLYLDGISTSNGLKYYGACGAPVILDADAAYEDLVTAAWPAHAAAAHDPGATLRDKVDYVGADSAGAAAFCASVARAWPGSGARADAKPWARTLRRHARRRLRARRSSSDGAKTHDALAMRLAGFNDVDDRGVRGPGRSAGLLPVLGAAATEGLLYDLALPLAAGAASSRRSALFAERARGGRGGRALGLEGAAGPLPPAGLWARVPGLPLPPRGPRRAEPRVRARRGDVAVMRAWWGDKYAAVVDARRAAISRAAPGGGAPPMACDRLYHDALLWRAVFAEFWAEEQLALVKAGAALGPDRYALARVEDLVADPGAARVLLDWVHGGAYGGDAAGGGEDLRGRGAPRRAAACDLLVAAAFQNPKDVRAGPLAFPKKCALLDFLDDAGGLPRRRWGLGVEGSGFHSRDVRGAAPRRARVGARLRVLAAVKGRCWARADAADAAVAASATGAPRSTRSATRPSPNGAPYSDDAPAPRAAAQDVYAALRPCVDLDCGGDSPTWAAGGRTCAWVAENPTRARCKVAGDDGAAARDACREACCRPAKPGKG
ncbi:hypothetical protein JL721_10922 [Aureococcus anophagefferens]|nr:hypothetical protein JL721_10922 [Aureococcus anophagefferens]